MARLWVWGFRVNVLIPDRRWLDHALTFGWRLSRLLLLICSGWVLSLRNGLLGRIVGRSGKGSSKTEAGSEEDQRYAYCCTPRNLSMAFLQVVFTLETAPANSRSLVERNCSADHHIINT